MSSDNQEFQIYRSWSIYMHCVVVIKFWLNLPSNRQPFENLSSLYSVPPKLIKNTWPMDGNHDLKIIKNYNSKKCFQASGRMFVNRFSLALCIEGNIDLLMQIWVTSVQCPCFSVICPAYGWDNAQLCVIQGQYTNERTYLTLFVSSCTYIIMEACWCHYTMHNFKEQSSLWYNQNCTVLQNVKFMVDY